MQSGFVLSVIMLNVVVMNVVAPFKPLLLLLIWKKIILSTFAFVKQKLTRQKEQERENEREGERER
jgi:hypothetical protein